MRVLVAIANYGIKNIVYLKRLINEYRSMEYVVDIVVLSDISKDLGYGIEVVIGLPSKNPWSLPFGHKQLFANRINNYDLFIYSEDDMLITEHNINAFLNVTQVLPDNMIAGFIRYEEGQSGKRYYPEVHLDNHWDPGFVKSYGEYTFAYFTNLHSASYILTREQLKKAIASGGYLVGPWEGRYDLLCTAATDPYTRCGFNKMICISHFKDFCVHHMPNVYIGKLGLEGSEVERHLKVLLEIGEGLKPSEQLFNTKTRLTKGIWDKKYYEPCLHDIVAMIPKEVKSILSIGCGWGATEAQLTARGIRVVGVPLDSVIAASAAARGVEVLSPNFDSARQELEGEHFDCLIFSNVLHHLSDPLDILSKFMEALSNKGFVIVSVPNFNHVSIWRKRLSSNPNLRETRYIGDFEKSGLHFTTIGVVKRWFRQCELKPVRALDESDEKYRWLDRLSFGVLNRILMSNVVMLATKD